MMGGTSRVGVTIKNSGGERGKIEEERGDIIGH